MYIPLNPNFKVSSAFPWQRSLPFCGQAWKSKPDDKVIEFSRGRWALALLALNILRLKGRTKGAVFIPEYFCEISLTPLRTNHVKLYFYRITPNFEPDIEHLNALAKQVGAPDLLLYVHYFGLPSQIRITADWCKAKGVLLVEDAAHALMPIPGIGDNGYPTIFTPWKFFNVYEGALLVLPSTMGDLVSEPDVRNMVSQYPWSWVAKKIMQNLATCLALPLHRLRPIYVKREDETESVPEIKNPSCSSFFERALSHLVAQVERVAEIRQRNYCLIDRLLTGIAIPIQQLFFSLPAKFGPYLYPLRIQNGRGREIMISLNRQGIPALPWSDLSPEVANSKEYPLANALRREILTLPVHQDLTEDQINWMMKEVICSTR